MGAPWLGEARAGWLADVSSWVRNAALHSGAGEVIGLDSVKERPWGAVLRVRTPGRSLYFKATGPRGGHELGIVGDIAEHWPTLVPDVVAMDTERSWMLMEDHGLAMRDVLDAAGQVAILEALLPTYAEMQAATIPRTGHWLAAGVPDRRVDLLPPLLELVLAGGSRSAPLPLDGDEHANYERLLPELARVCGDLASMAGSSALDHADMHGTNVIVADGRGRLVDWGDACITHPFSTLFVPYQQVVSALPASSERRAAVHRLRDAYLEPWGGGADRREAFGLAVWVAHVNRVITLAQEESDAVAMPFDSGHEIVGLLRAWHAKRHLLGSGDDLLEPI